MGCELRPGISPSREPPAAAYNKYPGRIRDAAVLLLSDRRKHFAENIRVGPRTRLCLWGWALDKLPAFKPFSILTGAHCFQVYIDCFVHTHIHGLKMSLMLSYSFFTKITGTFVFFQEQICHLFWTVPEAEKSGLGLASLSLLIRPGECGKARKEVVMASPWLRASPGLSVSEGLEPRHQKPQLG